MTEIEKQAIHYQNLSIVHPEYIAAVHLEDKEDEPFWKNQLNACKSGSYLL